MEISDKASATPAAADPLGLAGVFDRLDSFSDSLRSQVWLIAEAGRFWSEAKRIAKRLSDPRLIARPSQKRIYDDPAARRVCAHTVAIGGISGTAFHSLAGSTTDVRVPRSLAGSFTACVLILDFFVDEARRWRGSASLMESACETLRSGVPFEASELQLKATARELSWIHTAVRDAPASEIFFQEAEALVQANVERMREGGFRSDELVGACSSSTLAALVSAFDPGAACTLPAARHMGASLQLLDDVKDAEIDLANGCCTGVTLAPSLSSGKTEALRRAAVHYKLAVKAIAREQRPLFDAVWRLAVMQFPRSLRRAVTGQPYQPEHPPPSNPPPQSMKLLSNQESLLE